ncbi:uncharacterized protein SOCE26_052880 [Sorangium cellulosum]|uniref:Uncharacterized protein n=1 Tax=Sorangium cellulosum TaxID=56 RepID=A0A2L0EX13_SORCE|nr:hypothetical protein [Sorangium cellulosum]AUX43833.1 uncharacterized protein SOCE26_052880 [Sorangium cellulosum]
MTPGAQFQVGDRVVVLDVVDPEGAELLPHRGAAGVVVALDYAAGCGEAFPADPVIRVRLDAGARVACWAEELAPDGTVPALRAKVARALALQLVALRGAARAGSTGAQQQLADLEDAFALVRERPGAKGPGARAARPSGIAGDPAAGRAQGAAVPRIDGDPAGAESETRVTSGRPSMAARPLRADVRSSEGSRVSGASRPPAPCGQEGPPGATGTGASNRATYRKERTKCEMKDICAKQRT